MLETAITKPWKFLPYYALGYAMKEMFKDNFELDDEQYEGFKVSMSDYLREKAYGSFFPSAVIPFPYLDDNKRIQFMDVSYLYPWGMFSEMAGEITEGKAADAVKTAGLLGSPGLNIASAIMTGIDPFTRRQIVDETGTNIEKAADLVWYTWNLSAAFSILVPGSSTICLLVKGSIPVIIAEAMFRPGDPSNPAVFTASAALPSVISPAISENIPQGYK
jgi:hypothetical protein